MKYKYLIVDMNGMSEIVKKITEKLKECDFDIENDVRVQGSKKVGICKGFKIKYINRFCEGEIEEFSKNYGPLIGVVVKTYDGLEISYEPFGKDKWMLNDVFTEVGVSKDYIKKLQNVIEIPI